MPHLRCSVAKLVFKRQDEHRTHPLTHTHTHIDIHSEACGDDLKQMMIFLISNPNFELESVC